MSSGVIRGGAGMLRGMFAHRRRATAVDILRVAIAVVAAVGMCRLMLGTWQPVFGIIGALVSAQPLVRDSLGRALERGLVVVVGVASAYAAVALVGYEQWLGAASVVVVLLVVGGAGAGSAAAVQAGVIVILIVAPTASDPALVQLRLLETVIGTLVGVAVSVLAQPISVLGSARVLSAFGAELAAALEDVSRSVHYGGPVPKDLERLRSLRSASIRTRLAVERGRSSLDFSPFSRRRRIEVLQDEQVFVHLERLVIEATGLTRTLLESDGAVRRTQLERELAQIAGSLRATLSGKERPAPLASGIAKAGDAVQTDLIRMRSEITGLVHALGGGS